MFDSVAGIQCCALQKNVDDLVAGLIENIRSLIAEYDSDVVISKLSVTREDNPSPCADLESPPNPVAYSFTHHVDFVGY